MKTEYQRSYYLAHHQQSYFRHTTRRYGVSEAEYTRLLSQCGGVCMICKKTQSGRRMPVDHCHKTGKVRGLLCAKCNGGLGCFNDSLGHLRDAMQYLLERG